MSSKMGIICIQRETKLTRISPTYLTQDLKAVWENSKAFPKLTHLSKPIPHTHIPTIPNLYKYALHIFTHVPTHCRCLLLSVYTVNQRGVHVIANVWVWLWKVYEVRAHYRTTEFGYEPESCAISVIISVTISKVPWLNSGHQHAASVCVNFSCVDVLLKTRHTVFPTFVLND